MTNVMNNNLFVRVLKMNYVSSIRFRPAKSFRNSTFFTEKKKKLTIFPGGWTFCTERLRKEWTSPIYAFFKYSPAIHYVGDRRVHVFECLAQICKARGKNPRFVNRYLDKADARSTSNLRKHVKICWGTEIVAAADKIKDLEAIRAVIGKTELKDGSLAAAFEELERGKPTDMLSSPEINTETRGVVLR